MKNGKSKPAALAEPGSIYGLLEQAAKRPSRTHKRSRARAASRGNGTAVVPVSTPSGRVVAPAAEVVSWDALAGVETIATQPPPPPMLPAREAARPGPEPSRRGARPSSLRDDERYIEAGARAVVPLGDLPSEDEIRDAVEELKTGRRRQTVEQSVMQGFIDHLAAQPPPAPLLPEALRAAETAASPEEIDYAAVSGVAELSGPPAAPAPPAPVPAPAPTEPVAPPAGAPILTLQGSVGRGGENRPNDVTAVKQRLIALGFNWLTPDATVDQTTIETIQLFQAIKNGHAMVKGNSVNDGLVEVDKNTHRWLQAVNAPRWQLLPAGSRGEGFANDELTDTASTYDYGTSWLAETIAGAGATYKTNYLDANAAAALLTVNDGALPRGLPQPGEKVLHSGHQTGLEFDLRLPRQDGTAGGITWRDTKVYDQSAMRAILQALRAQPLHRSILFSDPVLVAEGLCTQWADHDDHAHVRIDPPAVGAVELAAPVVEMGLTRLLGVTPFDYNVPGIVALVGQPSPLTCWAATATMMVSWRDQASYAIQTVCDTAGAAYRSKFDAGQSVTRAELQGLFNALGMKAEAPACYTAEGLLALLRAHGPLWVIGDQDMVQNQLVHARVLTGMVGDGTEDGTRVRINDPIGPRAYEETFRRFSERLEAPDAVAFEIEVVHF